MLSPMAWERSVPDIVWGRGGCLVGGGGHVCGLGLWNGIGDVDVDVG